MVALVTGAESAKALMITRSLGSKGIEVHNAGINKESPTFSSKYSKKQFTYPDPEKNEFAFVKRLLDIVSNQDYEILIPSHSKETYIISKYISEFSSLVYVPLVNYNLMQKANDKSYVNLIANNLNISVPKTFRPKSIESFGSFEINFPVVIKLISGSSNKGLKYANSLPDLIQKFKEVVEEFNLTKSTYPIIQEYINGVGAGTSVLFDRGEPKSFFTHKRLREYPMTGGPSTLRIGIRNSTMEKNSIKLLSKMKWHGVAMCEYIIQSKTNIPYLIEINPRFWGSLNQSIISGVDFPLMLYKMSKRGIITNDKVRLGLKTRFLLLDLLSFPDYFLLSKDKVNFLLSFISNNKTYFDIEDLDDMSPVIEYYKYKLKEKLCI